MDQKNGPQLQHIYLDVLVSNAEKGKDNWVIFLLIF